VTGLLCTGQDVTERMRAEEERARLLENLTSTNEQLALTILHAQQQAAEAQRRAAELDAVFRSLTDGVVLYDPEGMITRMNPAAERLLGFSAADCGKPLAERLIMSRAVTADGKPIPTTAFPILRARRGHSCRRPSMYLRPLLQG